MTDTPTPAPGPPLTAQALAPGLAARLRLALDEPDDTDRAALEAALADACELALAEVPLAVAARWRTGAPAAAAVVVFKAARREFENPRGAIGESIGGHYLSLTQGNATGVYLTPSELETIHRAAGATRGKRVGTIRIKASYE